VVSIRFAQALRFDAVGHQAIEELVHNRLEPALRARRQHLLAQTFAALARQTHGFRTARWKRIHAWIPDARLVEGCECAVVGLVVVNQPVNGLQWGHRRDAGDLVRGGAEPGAFEEVGCAAGGPVASGDWRKVVGPRCCAVGAHDGG